MKVIYQIFARFEDSDDGVPSIHPTYQFFEDARLAQNYLDSMLSFSGVKYFVMNHPVHTVKTATI